MFQPNRAKVRASEVKQHSSGLAFKHCFAVAPLFGIGFMNHSEGDDTSFIIIEREVSAIASL
ncbi:MAG: hypothetical protein DMG06_05335 [Acidobacteria bacterium]|nr:MAG: hypothetical protein DMG06_05335 [Acidobacteriota bacterium]